MPSLDCVINYECPRNVEKYVHRIGRTARGTGQGTAFTILMRKEKKTMIEMLKSVENGDRFRQYDMRMKTIRFHRKYMDQYTELLNKVLLTETEGDLERNVSLNAESMEFE